MRLGRLTRAAALAAAVVLVATSCGNDSGGADEPAATDSAADSAASEETTTTAPIPEGGESVEGLQLTAVVFGGDGHVTLTNTSDTDVSLEGLWLCNRPAYIAISGSLAPGATVDVAASDLSGLSADGGEAGLYSSSDFGSADAMMDYVSWGSGGGRASVAVDAGLWPPDVTVSPTSDSIVLNGAPGDPEAWS